MAEPLRGEIRVHNLLHLDLKLGIEVLVGDSAAPQWILKSPNLAEFVHVRRGLIDNREYIPVGIRGTSRSERWGTTCLRRFVQSVTSPEQLLSRPIPLWRFLKIPAFQALEKLKVRWANLRLPWGPAGSVGFELLTGREVTTQESDLDIVIYAQERIRKEEAATIYDRAALLSTKMDIRVETGYSGFSLKEYGDRRTTRYLLRTPSGEVLNDDPWHHEF